MRRRPFNRPLRRILRGAADIPPALQRANELLTIGDFAGASVAFENLAARAEANGGPRAPWLFLQAGRARIGMGSVEGGVAHLKQGLALLVAQGRYGQALHAGRRIVDELSGRGLNKEAGEISEYLRGALPAQPAPASAPSAARAALPTHCPACGGPVRSDEVEWIDDSTAECPYCGSPVRGE